MKEGIEHLSNAELLALILKTGTKKANAIDLANIILSRFPVETIENIDVNELLEIDGIGKMKAAQIKAIYELHKRFSRKTLDSPIKVYSPKDIYENIKCDIEGKEQEHLLVLYLKGNKVISKKVIAIGTDSCTLISQKNILAPAVKENAQAIIVAHNHPSGENFPSKEDIAQTQKLNRLARELDIQLLDHLIITKDKYYSFRINQLIL